MEKRAGNRGAWCLLSSAAALALAAWAAGYAVRGEPRLLDQSRRLADAGFWSQDFGAYFWETDRSVLTFRPEGRSVRAVSVDLPSRSETPRTALSEAIAEAGDGVRSWRLSPDGRLLLWCDFRPQGQKWTASELSGKRVKSWNVSSGFLPLWLPDNRRWIGNGPGRSGFRYDGVGTYFLVNAVDAKSAELQPTPGPCDWPVGITPDNHVVSLHWKGVNGSGNTSMEWFEYSLESKPAAGPHGKAVMPRAASGLNEAELSPNGRFIACFVQYTYLSPVEQLLGRFFHIPVRPHQKVGLWVVDRTLSSACLIGSEEGPPPFGLLWTPDGKRLSYIQNGTLYGVAAPLTP